MKKRLLLLLFALIAPQFITPMEMEEPSYSWFGSKPKKPKYEKEEVMQKEHAKHLNFLQAIDNNDSEKVDELLEQNPSLIRKKIYISPALEAQPLAYAIAHKKEAVIFTLINHDDCPINSILTENSAGNLHTDKSAIYLALTNGLWQIVDQLLVKGADLTKIYVQRQGNTIIKELSFKEALQDQEKSMKKIAADFKKSEEAKAKKSIATAQITTQPGLIAAIIEGDTDGVKAALKTNENLLDHPIYVEKIKDSKLQKKLRTQVYTAIPNYVKKKLGGYSYRSEVGRLRTGLNALRHVQPYFTDYGTAFIRKKLKIANKPHFWQQTMTPLYFALFMGQEEIAKLLVDKGAKLLEGYVLNFSLNFSKTATDEHDYYIQITQTPLYFAAKRDLPTSVQFLVDKIKELKVKERDVPPIDSGYELSLTERNTPTEKIGKSLFLFKQSPLRIATKKEFVDIIEILKKAGATLHRAKLYPQAGTREKTGATPRLKRLGQKSMEVEEVAGE